MYSVPAVYIQYLSGRKIVGKIRHSLHVSCDASLIQHLCDIAMYHCYCVIVVVSMETGTGSAHVAHKGMGSPLIQTPMYLK